MQIILASANPNKIREIGAILGEFGVLSYRDFLDEIEVIEDGKSFEENAILKAKCIYEALAGDVEGDFLVLADDSGLCVEALGGMPGIYSARFASIQASISDLIVQNFNPPLQSAKDEQNNLKLIECLESLGLWESKACFVCAIAVQGKVNGKEIAQTFWGECHGKVVRFAGSSGGFGYDPLFVPEGYDLSMDQIPEKNTLSHRFHALKQCKALIADLKR